MEDNIKILIIEDEILIADYIRDILTENGYSEIYTSHSVKDATEKMDTLLPDIILMDINIEGHFEGIELSQQKNKEALVIFITGQTDLSTIKNALSSSPENYLSKPIRKIELITAVKIAIGKKQRNYIVVRDGYRKINLHLADLVYVRSDKNYIDLITTTSKITLRMGLLEFAKQLPSYFRQIHRSIIINMHYLEKKDSDEVTVKGEKLPISRSYRENL